MLVLFKIIFYLYKFYNGTYNVFSIQQQYNDIYKYIYGKYNLFKKI